MVQLLPMNQTSSLYQFLSLSYLESFLQERSCFFISFESNQSCIYQYTLTDQTTFSKFQKFSPSNSKINCFVFINNHYLLLGESNSVIYVFVGDFSQKGEMEKKSIAFHSHPIVSIDGNTSLDLIASIDSQHYVIYSSLMNCKYIHSYKLECDEKSEHIIKVNPGGIVVISSSFANSSELQFFDLTGQCLKSIKFGGTIVRIESLNLNDKRSFIIISTSYEIFTAISLITFQQCTIPGRRIYNPRFFFAHHDSLTITAANKDDSQFVTFPIPFQIDI
jgi:hypothetical protein